MAAADVDAMLGRFRKISSPMCGEARFRATLDSPQRMTLNARLSRRLPPQGRQVFT